MKSPLDEIKGKRVTGVDLKDECTIVISFDNIGSGASVFPEIGVKTQVFDGIDKKLQLNAYADCCSESWFETLNEPFESMVGKEIKTIEETKEDIKMPPSNRQDCDQNCKVVVKYMDGMTFEFLLRNSSNGYYSGCLGMCLV